MLSFLLVFVGGGLGSIARFVLGPAIQGLAGGWGFPIGTFLVNMIGCFFIGLCAGLAEYRSLFSLEGRHFFFVGILGGFTTFSTFGLETFQLMREGQILYAAANGGLQVALGVLLVWLGFSLARLF